MTPNNPESRLFAFLLESNQIEGIFEDPTQEQIDAFRQFLNLGSITIPDLEQLQALFAPGMPLRTREGWNVRVGNHIAPKGGPQISGKLQEILYGLHYDPDRTPYESHHEFEALHPFLDGNGRTGRMLWAWHMQASGRDPFSLSFLHRWYYQSLEEGRNA